MHTDSFFKGFGREHARAVELIRKGELKEEGGSQVPGEVIEELVARGLVYKHKGRLFIDSEYGYFLGIDIGGTSAKSMLIDFGFKAVAGSFRSEDRGSDITAFKRNLEKALDGTMASANPRRILGIGIALPGTVDPSHGRVLFTTNIQFLSGLKAVELLPRKYASAWADLPIKLEHDCKAAVLAEKLAGGPGHTERKEASIVAVTVGTGVSAGSYVNGSVIRGATNAAGEFGHILVNGQDGRQCGCGKVGCLEAEASGSAMQAKWLERTGTKATVVEIAEAAMDGNAEAIELFKETGRWLGLGLSYIVNLMEPDLITLYGGVSAAYDLFSESLNETLSKHAWPLANWKVERSMIGSEIVGLGAALVAYEHILGSAA
ncbi:MAG TPA: ROK family protein [Bacillota bacterium]|nr:MAG: N-acetylglucosamine repressor [Firmicutes bacterium ADurb.Bin153]HNV35137.1 ROK family protein [Bacillota bacterium]